MTFAQHVGITANALLSDPWKQGSDIMRHACLRWSNLTITQAGSIIAVAGALPNAWNLAQHLSHSLYRFIRQFFLSSVIIPANDPLNKSVVRWLHANRPRHHRAFTSRTQVGSSYNDRGAALKRTRHTTQYLPHWSTRWFFYESNLFLVSRNASTFSSALSDPSCDGIGTEELEVSCFGYSIDPVKVFLESCRAYADRQAQYFVIVYARDRYGLAWKPKTRKPIRRLDTVHFDGATKKSVIEDVRNYLDMKTQKRYESRSMPYRRGYLFYGPPGTGKSSLSLAIAGEFGLDLYEVKVPSVGTDADLEQMFQEIPPRCVVLLEDIDAIWADRSQASKKQDHHEQSSSCTLSGLLNVLDGVGSQEGRIVIMTTNHLDRLDSALIRPGRVDMRVHLGNISQEAAREMFVRMFSSDSGCNSTVPEDQLQELASVFASHIPADTITPSRLQGFFQLHLDGPEQAATNIASWLHDEGVTEADEAGFENVF
ncbi:ATPase family associated with various cellular activities (AAA) domain-containing protein [Sarocladium implicatum]|nr:ATPase family associated with various cellular activities (AAA) domain-containing protein [Sarocladium implicatum]